jgi:hypothetical protein
MQFVKGGPDLPESLLQAHEDGKVVFFCGAGISYPADLPGFKGLVDKIYAAIGTSLTDIERQAYSRGQFDATLDLLEHRFPGQRLAVRRVLPDVLTPNLRRKGATATHSALLQLARSHDGAIRLVTTNFDRIFQRLIVRSKPIISVYPAPLLPIPKASRWDGVVYLHGLMPEASDESALHRLVLTSGDFGLAYLTERWAARFVGELFRNYIVCFVGYSINDPVLRYMMDALAADRMLGEVTPQAYALGEFSSEEELQRRTEWEAKGVYPILYEVPSGTSDHSALHRTIKAWAETYRDGIQGRERVVVDYAMAKPLASTKQDDYVGRMLWALSHSSGLPAKRFAEFNPAPSLEWLEALSESRYRHPDLPRFGVPIGSQHDSKLTFSLLHRPAPYTHAPRMKVTLDHGEGQWDDLMFQLARWLIRHLNDPGLVLWLAKRGGKLRTELASLIEDRLDELTKLEADGNADELERIRTNGPNAIPHPLMRVIWRVLLSGRIASSHQDIEFFRWKKRLTRDGFTSTLRLQLRELLSPKVSLAQAFRWRQGTIGSGDPGRVKDLVDWELVVGPGHTHVLIEDLAESAAWKAALPALLEDFQQLLHDALDLMRELGDADDRTDLGCWDMPSISPHWQNRGFHEWVTLIVLLRDAWEATRKDNPNKAHLVARDWFMLPYPTFKRLALYAAAQGAITSDGEWVDWLASDDDWWVWSVETQRECMRLLVLQGANLTSAKLVLLETKILAGPPRPMFRESLEPDEWKYLADHMIWLRLSKLDFGGSKLGNDASEKLRDLSAAYPEWKLTTNESDEFSHWMSGTSDPDYADRHQIDRAPRRRRELARWLQRSPPETPFYEDDWREICLAKFPVAACSLCALALENQWPVNRWREALQAWSGETLIRRSWRFLSPVLQRMPDHVLLQIAQSATWWMESASKVLDSKPGYLSRFVLPLPKDAT